VKVQPSANREAGFVTSDAAAGYHLHIRAPALSEAPACSGEPSYTSLMVDTKVGRPSVGNNIILQYIALFGAYYISAILRIAISY